MVNGSALSAAYWTLNKFLSSHAATKKLLTEKKQGIIIGTTVIKYNITGLIVAGKCCLEASNLTVW